MITNKRKCLPLWIPAERFCQVIKLVWTSEQQLWSNKKEIENLQPRAAHTSLGPSHAGRTSGSRRAQARAPAGEGLREGGIKESFTWNCTRDIFMSASPEAKRPVQPHHAPACAMMLPMPCSCPCHAAACTTLLSPFLSLPRFCLFACFFLSEGQSLTYRALPSPGYAQKSVPQPPKWETYFCKIASWVLQSGSADFMWDFVA